MATSASSTILSLSFQKEKGEILLSIVIEGSFPYLSLH